MADRIARATPVILASGAIAFLLLATLVATGLVDPFDRGVISIVRHPALHDPLAVLRVITELGSTWFITVMAVFVALLGLLIRRPAHGMVGALTILLASVMNSQFKATLARQRPDLLDPLVVEHGFSFPSGHSALSAVAYGVLAVMVARAPLPRPVRVAIGVAAVIIISAVGVSRIYLGVHYPSDVLAGWLAGFLVVLIYAALTRVPRIEPTDAA